VLVDKPAGLTSHDIVQQVRRKLGTRAVGHTGTLDPFATGLLLLLVGRATRLAQFLEAQPKTYLATARLGVRTTTDDLTGQVIGNSESGGSVPEHLVRTALAELEGVQLQQPPQYSAKHVGGERSYHKARRGEAVELADVSVTVHGIELVQYRPPCVSFRAQVSTGTYIRALARDLGERLGVGAHLTELRREAIGPLRVEDAVPLERIGRESLLSALALLGHLPSVELDQAGREDVAHGRAVVDGRAAGQRGSGAVALLAEGELVAVARTGEGVLYPTVVLESPRPV
jgi:tRNA pseudouridine55 synthase